MANTQVIAPDGTPGTVPAEQLDAAIQQGYKLPGEPKTATKEDLYGGVSGGLAAGIMGVMQGAAPGGGAALASDPVAKTVTKGLAEQHPIASGVGNLIGQVVSPVSRLLPVGTAATGVGRIGQAVASGALSQGLFGAGNAVSESALGNEQLTAEHVASSAGIQALLGAGGGLVGGVLGEGATKAAGALKASAEGEGFLARNGRWMVMKAMGATQKDFDYLGEKKVGDVADMMLERGHLGSGFEAPNAKGVLDRVRNDLEQQRDTLNGLYAEAVEKGAKPNYEALTERLNAFEKEISPLQREAIAGEVEKTRNAVLDYATRPEGEGAKSGFNALRELKQDLQDQAKWSDQAEEFKGLLKRQLAGATRDEMEKQLLPQMGEGFGEKFKSQNKLVSQLLDAEHVALHGVSKLEGNNVLGPIASIAGIVGLFTRGPLGGLGGAGLQIAKNRGPALAARLANAIGTSPILSTIAEHFGQAVSKSAPAAFGAFREPLMNALSISPEHALATHMVLAQGFPEYANAVAPMGFGPETPEQRQSAIDKATTLTHLKAAAATHDEKLGKLVDGVVAGRDKPATPAPMDVGAFHDAASDVRMLAQNPQEVAKRVAANLGSMAGHAPVTAAAVASTAQRAVQFLDSKLPKPPQGGPLMPVSEPSRADVAKFGRYAEVVNEPQKALRLAAQGRLSPEGLEALQKVWPALYQRVQAHVVNRLGDEGPGTVSYRQRQQLAKLAGADMDGTRRGNFIQGAQLSYASNAREQSQQGTKKSSDKLARMTVAERTSASMGAGPKE